MCIIFSQWKYRGVQNALLGKQQRLSSILITWTGKKVSPRASLGSYSFEPCMVKGRHSLGTSEYWSFSGLTTPLSLPPFYSFLLYIPSVPLCSISSFHTLPTRPPFQGLFLLCFLLAPSCTTTYLAFFFCRPCSGKFPPTLAIGSHYDSPYPYPSS